MRFRDVHYPIALKRALRPVVRTARYAGLRREDVLLASYPRSGSTWLRFLVTEVVTGREVEWVDVDRVVPDVGRHRDAPSIVEGRGRFVKTHDASSGPCGRAVLLVRDARDVALSEYRSRVRAGAEESVDGFLESARDGKLSAFGSWSAHTRYWLDGSIARRGDLLLIRFEEMKTDTGAVLTSVLGFLGITAADDLVGAAVAHNSTERMREKEDRARSEGIIRRFDGVNYFVGQGGVGGWRAKLSLEQASMIEQEAGPVLERLGYPIGDGLA